LGLLVGGIYQPHDEKEAHHCRHEIGKGDFPDATVAPFVLIVVAPPDDDDFLLAIRVVRQGHARISDSACDHSAMRVSNTASSTVTTRSKPGASVNSSLSECVPKALRNDS